MIGLDKTFGVVGNGLRIIAKEAAGQWVRLAADNVDDWSEVGGNADTFKVLCVVEIELVGLVG